MTNHSSPTDSSVLAVTSLQVDFLNVYQTPAAGWVGLGGLGGGDRAGLDGWEGFGGGGKISPDLRDRLSATVEERGTQWVNTTEHFL